MARARTTLPRLAVNATLAGFWAATLLALLLFYLNAQVTLTPRHYAPTALVIVAVYGPASGIAWSLLAGAVRLFVAFRVRVPWVGFRPFWRFFVADLVVLSVLFLHNLRESRAYLSEGMRGHLASATLLLGAGTAMLVLDALRRGLGRRRQRPLRATLAAVLLTAALFGIRERYRDADLLPSASEIEVVPPHAAVLLLGLDGATADDLFPMAADGRLPMFGELIRAGTSAPLHASQPPRVGAAWGTVLTGREPAAHGLVDEVTYAPPGGRPVFQVAPVDVGLSTLDWLGVLSFERPAAPLAGVPTVDTILRRCGYQVIAAGWNGLLLDTTRSPVLGAMPVPAALQAQLDTLGAHLDAVRAHRDGGPLARALVEAMRDDIVIIRATLAALDRQDVPGPSAAVTPAVLLRMRGLDRVAHVFIRYLRPDRFGNVPARDVETFGAVIPDYYRFIDAWLALLRQRLGPDTTVMVASPYGVSPVSLGRRVRQAITGAGHVSGTHRGAGPGVLVAAGPGVRSGEHLEHAAAVDVLPTLLYLRDLPVGRDMEGQPLDRLPSDDFAERHALAAVPSWETVSIVGPPH